MANSDIEFPLDLDPVPVKRMRQGANRLLESVYPSPTPLLKPFADSVWNRLAIRIEGHNVTATLSNPRHLGHGCVEFYRAQVLQYTSVPGQTKAFVFEGKIEKISLDEVGAHPYCKPIRLSKRLG